jgi:hypothetical protein
MRWVQHALSDILRVRREELWLEPRRITPPHTERYGNHDFDVLDLSYGRVSLSSRPLHRDLRGGWNHTRDRYQVNGLYQFVGQILLQTDDGEWRIAWLGQDGGPSTPILNPTLVDLDRVKRLEALWMRRFPKDSAVVNHYPTGCTRTLILLEFGAVVNTPAKWAQQLNAGNFHPSLAESWPSMAAWIHALGGDPASGRVQEERGVGIEVALLRLPPPILPTLTA